MTVTAATLRQVDADLSSFARSLDAQEAAVSAALDAARGALDHVASCWGGPRATEVLAAGRSYIADVTELPAAVASARTTVARLAASARATASALAVQEAELRRVSVVVPLDPAAFVDAIFDRSRVSGQVAALAAQWERTAAAMAGELSAAVDVVRRSAGAGVGERPSGWFGRGPGAAAGADPVAAWWVSLTFVEQIVALVTRPALGNTDGIPAWGRDVANRIRLEADLERLMVGEHRGTLSPLEAQTLANARAAAMMLDDHEAFTVPLSGDKATAQLYIYEPAAFGGDGRIAVAIGDMDTARHIAVTVPGLLSDAGGLDPDKSQDIFREARLASGEDVAVLDWMGYDAPSFSSAPGGGLGDQISEGFDIVGVVNMGLATKGAEQLARDVAGIVAMRGTSDPHLTVVGNSYGSTTAAIAADEYDLGADDLVLSGSPGAGRADDADDLITGRDHTWVASASTDFVSYLGTSGGWDPADHLADVLPGVEQMGNDPSEDAFDANRMRAEYSERNTDGPLNFPGDIEGHGQYYVPGSESLYNISAVVAGEYDAVLPAEPRHKEPFVEPHNPVSIDFDGDWLDLTPFIDDVDVRAPVEVNQFPVDPEAAREPTESWTHAG